MSSPATSANENQQAISTATIDAVCSRLRENKPIHVPLPGDGMLHMDRALPFLCVYRRNPNRRDDGTSRLVTAEASYLCAPGQATVRPGLIQLIRRIAEVGVEQLESFLILEIWSADDRDEFDTVTGELKLPRPGFRILTRRPHRPDGTVATLEFALQELRSHRRKADVHVDLDADNHPPGMKPLVSAALEAKLGCYVLGLEVRPIYRDPNSGETYDRELQSFSRQLSHALKQAFFAFSMNRTNLRPEHYFALGKSRLSKQVLTIDRQLAELSRQFKFLLLVTPMNAERAWKDFAAGGYRKSPRLDYRPLDADPLLMKRRLMRIPTERVDHPTLAYVFRQTQYELDRQITMLADIGTFRFLPGSLQVFAGVAPQLRNLAEKILAMPTSRDPSSGDAEMLAAKRIARFADQEIKYYREQSAGFAARATIRDDIYSGLMVSGGELLIGKETKISKRRIDALMQHEVGTHLVTHHNGGTQSLHLLQVGLAGYDALQEGLAVLSEYLVGGLSEARVRTLAARVIAVDQLIKEASFPDVFSQLVDHYGFEPRTAYTITLRVFRGGGLTKDALYLQGLVEIIDYLGRGGDLEPLLVGKIAVEHVPIIQELLLSGVLRPPPLRPRYLDQPESQARLKTINSSTTVLDLISTERIES